MTTACQITRTKRCIREAYRAVAERNSAGELDEVASRDVVQRQEVDEVVDAVRDTVVGYKERLDGWEEKHRTVGSSAAIKYVQRDAAASH